MDNDTPPPVSKEDALASLGEIDRIMSETRKNIAAGSSGPIIILWGVVWFVAYGTTQFFPRWSNWTWTVADIVGIGGSILLSPAFRKTPVKTASQWQRGAAWFILFGFALLWIRILCPWEMSSNRAIWVSIVPLLARKISAFMATVAMFAYILAGLWLDRFFIWLGALVTVATLIGYLYIKDYFYLWMAITGGGSLIVGGVFIRKFWR